MDGSFSTREQRILYLQKFLATADEYTKGLVTPIIDVMADNSVISGLRRAAVIAQATEFGWATGDLDTMFNYLNSQLSKLSTPPTSSSQLKAKSGNSQSGGGIW
jgi:hypothetical protein